MEIPPIILTLQLDAVAAAYFNTIRKQYFPSELNFIDAHLSLFHQLPAHEPLIFNELKEIIKRPIINLDITGIKNIGNGVAFTIASPELQLLHKQMQEAFTGFLIPQDKQKLWPHITIQNKVDAAVAKQTTELLSRNFKPFSVQGIGINSWYYLGGPWQHHQSFLFEPL